MRILTLMLAVNDEYGNPDGRIEGVSISSAGREIAEINARRFPRSFCPRFSLLDGKIRISRRTFPILGYKEWVGNWCWDAAAIQLKVALDVLEYTRSIGWGMEGGDCWIGDVWDSGQKFLLSDLGAASMTEAELYARKFERSIPRKAKSFAGFLPPDISRNGEQEVNVVKTGGETTK